MGERAWSAARPTPAEGRSSVSTEQRENLEAVLRQSAFPAGIDVSEQRRRLAELTPAQPLPADVTVTAAALGAVPTAEITLDGIEPRHVVLYFHGGVYVLGDAFQAADLAWQVGRRTRAKVISVGYRLAPSTRTRRRSTTLLPPTKPSCGAAQPRRTSPSRESPSAGLAVATLVNARDHGLPRPAAAFVMSPYADLTLAGTTMETKREVDVLMSRENLQSRVTDYTAGQDAALGLISPIFADLSGLPPLIIQGRNSRGSPRQRRPPRPASCHRRRRGHLGHHPWGAARLPNLLSDPRRGGRCTGQGRTAPVGTSRQRRTRHCIAKARTQGMTDLRTSRGRLPRICRAGHSISRSPRTPCRPLGQTLIRRTLANREFTWHSQSLHQAPGIRRTTRRRLRTGAGWSWPWWLSPS